MAASETLIISLMHKKSIKLVKDDQLFTVTSSAGYFDFDLFLFHSPFYQNSQALLSRASISKILSTSENGMIK